MVMLEAYKACGKDPSITSLGGLGRDLSTRAFVLDDELTSPFPHAPPRGMHPVDNRPRVQIGVTCAILVCGELHQGTRRKADLNIDD